MAKNELPVGKGWENSKFNWLAHIHGKMARLTLMLVLTDDVGLGGGFSVWLTKERREWLSGRWLDARWDVEELERRKEDIIAKDLLKFRMLM